MVTAYDAGGRDHHGNTKDMASVHLFFALSEVYNDTESKSFVELPFTSLS